MIRSRMGLVLLVLLMVLALLSACGVSQAPSTSPSPTPAGKPKYGGEMHRMALGQPATFNSQRVAPYAVDHVLPVFNTLIRYDPNKLDVIPDTIEGDLAEKWEVSPDGKTYTFYLAKGVKWHDGKPFTADDVVYSIQRMMDRNRSGLARMFPTYQSVQKVDDYTVKVLLNEVQPSFLGQLARAEAIMLAKHYHDGVDEKSTAFLMGTGPFKFKSMVSGVEMVYERNPDYFKKDKSGNRLPYMDGLKISVIADYRSYLNSLLAKQLDMTNPGGGLSSIDVINEVKAKAPEMVIQWKSTPGMTGIMLNQKSIKPLQDVARAQGYRHGHGPPEGGPGRLGRQHVPRQPARSHHEPGLESSGR